MLTADGVSSEIMDDVTVEDACMFLARFKSGALGTFEATRFAAGRKNYNHIEINLCRFLLYPVFFYNQSYHFLQKYFPLFLQLRWEKNF